MYFNNYNLSHHATRYKPDIFVDNRIIDSSISIGDILSIGVLAITAYVIYLQVLEARKSTQYLEYSVRPTAWFVLISGNTLGLTRHITEYTSKFIVWNGSKFKILFYFKINWKINGEVIHSQDSRWENDPLHIYPEHSGRPGRGEYLSLIMVEDVLRDRDVEGVSELVADISYRVAPTYAPYERKDGLPETWRFNLIRKMWIGPNGVEDNGII